MRHLYALSINLDIHSRVKTFVAEENFGKRRKDRSSESTWPESQYFYFGHLEMTDDKRERSMSITTEKEEERHDS